MVNVDPDLVVPAHGPHCKPEHPGDSLHEPRGDLKVVATSVAWLLKISHVTPRSMLDDIGQLASSHDVLETGFHTGIGENAD